MQQTLPPGHNDPVIEDARYLTLHHVKKAAEAGRLQSIALDQKAFICELACGPLATMMVNGPVTIVMLERWVMEAISWRAQNHNKPILTGQNIYQLAMKAGSDMDHEWIWWMLPQMAQDFYERMAELLNEALCLCDSCGERKPDGLHEVAGMHLCSRCISPPREEDEA